jgi:hemerythrin-like domain-containing protein
MAATRIEGPLRTWYDLHEALATEMQRLVDAAQALAPGDAVSLDELTDRFRCFAGELRTHSEVEDGIMFPAIRARGGVVDDGFTEEHHHEQQLVYDASSALLESRALGAVDSLVVFADTLDRLRDSLVRHLEAEEADVLPFVAEHFDDAAQGELLRSIIGSVPADPRLQPWVAAALSPEHREARIRNMAAALPPETFAAVMRQIRDGVPRDVWADIVARAPELASSAPDRTGES